MKIRTMTWFSGACVGLVLAACDGSAKTDEPAGGGGNVAVAGYLYVGACTPSACDGLPVSEIGCADGQPEYVCSAQNGNQCSVTVNCPAPSTDPDQSVSFAPCAESECGPKPTTPAEACPDGFGWGGSTCGKLNEAACAWANGCYPKKDPITVDASQIGKACGVDVQCEAPDLNCVTFPPETGVEGAHCVADPCAAISCPNDKCTVLETYPAQVRCL